MRTNRKNTLTFKQLKKLVRENVEDEYLDPYNENEKEIAHIENQSVTIGQLRKAEQILIDNGIDEDEVDTVLQAVGYALLDMELYPDKDRDYDHGLDDLIASGYYADSEEK